MTKVIKISPIWPLRTCSWGTINLCINLKGTYSWWFSMHWFIRYGSSSSPIRKRNDQFTWLDTWCRYQILSTKWRPSSSSKIGFWCRMCLNGRSKTCFGPWIRSIKNYLWLTGKNQGLFSFVKLSTIEKLPHFDQCEVTSFVPMTDFWKLEKTNLEIAIKEGIYFNLDNVDEVLKVEDLLNTSCKGNLSEFSGRWPSNRNL